LLARKGSSAVVEMMNVEVAGFAPGVTEGGVNEKDVFAGRPVAVKVIEFANAVFTGFTVMPYMAF